MSMNMKEYDIILFKDSLNKFDIELTDKQLEQFIQYYELLIEWNSFMNLTAITEFQEVIKKHFIDSISLVKAIPNLEEQYGTVIDIGTGAGFPGIPLKIVFPKLQVTLLDSLKKRVQFLDKVVNTLELSKVSIIHGRAEDYARPDKLREKFDLCVSRAVANLTTLSEYCIPFVKINGYFISYKSEKIVEEYENAKNAIKILGGRFERQVDFLIPNSDIYRNLFIIKKEKVTPVKYPRKAGVPSREPIHF